jgi:hypothetical protein
VAPSASMSCAHRLGVISQMKLATGLPRRTIV